MILYSILSILLILLSPLIVLSNVLILSAWVRFKRLRTPSNILIVSLSSADLGLGLLLPSSVAIDLSLSPLLLPHEDSNSSVPFEPTPDPVCPASFSCLHLALLLTFSSAALLSISSIALDRFLSVGQPLRYNHFVTMSHVQKFILAAWAYSVLVPVLPLLVLGVFEPEVLILFVSLLVYVPALSAAGVSYGYIYVIARSHARAIYSVEISLNHSRLLEMSDMASTVTHHGGQNRYGLTLALLLAALLCWVPVQVCAAVDVWAGSGILEAHHWRLLAVLPIVSTCLLNPWLYAYRSSEVRLAVIRILDGILCRLTGRPTSYPIFYGHHPKGGAEMTSCGSNVRLLAISPTQTTVGCSHSHSPSRNNSNVGVGNGTLGENLNNGFPKLSNGLSPPSPNLSLDQRNLHFLICDYQVSTL